jgi:hypothetical protein
MIFIVMYFNSHSIFSTDLEIAKVEFFQQNINFSEKLKLHWLTDAQYVFVLTSVSLYQSYDWCLMRKAIMKSRFSRWFFVLECSSVTTYTALSFYFILFSSVKLGP